MLSRAILVGGYVLGKTFFGPSCPCFSRFPTVKPSDNRLRYASQRHQPGFGHAVAYGRADVSTWPSEAGRRPSGAAQCRGADEGICGGRAVLPCEREDPGEGAGDLGLRG